MIPAAEALKLPTAQLTDEERAAADKLEADIEEHVRVGMQRRGVDLSIKEINGNVIAEVNQRLKAAGFTPQWQAQVERHKLNAALQAHVGYKLSLSPSDQAYTEAHQLLLS